VLALEKLKTTQIFAELIRKILQGNRINEMLNYGGSENVPTTLKYSEKK